MNVKMMKLTPDFIEKCVVKSTEKRIPLCLVSDPGIGKTEMLIDLSERMGWGIKVVPFGDLLLEELTGLPDFEKSKDLDTTLWKKPELLNMSTADVKSKTGKWILFLDDIHLADSSIQKPLFRLLTHSKIKSWGLGENVAIVCAANYSEQGGEEFYSAIINRMMIVPIVPDFESWRDWAIRKEVHDEIVAFLAYDRSCFSSSGMTTRQWPSPRAWTKLSRFCSDGMDPIDYSEFFVGPDAGNKFSAFCTVLRKYDGRTLLKDKPKFSDDEIDNYIRLISMAMAIKDCDKNDIDRFVGVHAMAGLKSPRVKPFVLIAIAHVVRHIARVKPNEINELIGKNIVEKYPEVLR